MNLPDEVYQAAAQAVGRCDADGGDIYTRHMAEAAVDAVAPLIAEEIARRIEACVPGGPFQGDGDAPRRMSYLTAARIAREYGQTGATT